MNHIHKLTVSTGSAAFGPVFPSNRWEHSFDTPPLDTFHNLITTRNARHLSQNRPKRTMKSMGSMHLGKGDSSKEAGLFSRNGTIRKDQIGAETQTKEQIKEDQTETSEHNILSIRRNKSLVHPAIPSWKTAAFDTDSESDTDSISDILGGPFGREQSTRDAKQESVLILGEQHAREQRAGNICEANQEANPETDQEPTVILDARNQSARNVHTTIQEPTVIYLTYEILRTNERVGQDVGTSTIKDKPKERKKKEVVRVDKGIKGSTRGWICRVKGSLKKTVTPRKANASTPSNNVQVTRKSSSKLRSKRLTNLPKQGEEQCHQALLDPSDYRELTSKERSKSPLGESSGLNKHEKEGARRLLSNVDSHDDCKTSKASSFDDQTLFSSSYDLSVSEGDLSIFVLLVDKHLNISYSLKFDEDNEMDGDDYDEDLDETASVMRDIIYAVQDIIAFRCLL
jgi:hypothetical protein